MPFFGGENRFFANKTKNKKQTKTNKNKQKKTNKKQKTKKKKTNEIRRV